MLANTLELIYDVIVKPNSAMRYIAATEPRQAALLTFFFWVLISTLASLSIMPQMLLPMIVASAMAGAMGFAFAGAILHLTSSLLGGNGRLQALLCALPFASLPNAFTVLLPLIYYFPSVTAQTLAGVFACILQIWSFYLVIVAIRHIYSLSTWRAVLSTILPLCVVLLFFVTVTILLMAGLANAITTQPEIWQGIGQGAPF